MTSDANESDEGDPTDEGSPDDDGPDLGSPDDSNTAGLDPDGQLAELLGAPDRDRCPGARPVVSVSEHDDPAFIAEVTKHCRATPLLERRGVLHGALAELSDDHIFVPQDPLKVLSRRWEDARPIVLHEALPEALTDDPGWGADSPPPVTDGGLARLASEALRGEGSQASDEFRDLGPRGYLKDERDLAARRIAWRGGRSGRANIDDLWVKTQRLSMHADDESLRMRFSFGHEGRDDASRDIERHELVTRLAERFFPAIGSLHRDSEINDLLGEWMSAKPLMTQTIAYWNAPGGGALFHHDAFDEPLEGRQRGVFYAQVTGLTFWLALSIEDLAHRVIEFVELIDDGTLAELAGDDPQAGPFAPAFAIARGDIASVTAELALPGCGALSPIVNQGPEFTALLSDAGHGYVLGPGDAIVIPNHGLERTCMHSVFCASPDMAFSFSMALRESEPAGSQRPVSQKGHGSRRRSRRGSRGTGHRSAGGRKPRRSSPGSKRKRK